jgi:hypothetical protein
MALNPQIALPDSCVVTLNTLPAQVQQMSVNDAAVSIFNNFVEQVARVSPGASTMKEKPPIPTTQLRRSQQFVKPVEAPQSLPSTSEQPTSEKRTAQKVFHI